MYAIKCMQLNDVKNMNSKKVNDLINHSKETKMPHYFKGIKCCRLLVQICLPADILRSAVKVLD